MPRLTLKNLKNSEEQIFNLPQDTITLGRTSDCDVELADKSISRKHAQIMQEGEDYYLVDLKSGNGTYLNGKKIRPVEKQLLRPGDLIKIENFEVKFGVLDELLRKAVEEDTDTDIVEVKMIRKILGALSKDGFPSLEILNGSAEGKKIEFRTEIKELNIGRDPECNLPIEDSVISRVHAKLIRKLGGIVLVDLESRNGTFVNNEKIHEKLLRDGDKIMLGTIKLLYRNSQDVNIDVISEEISRKKREAALREAEMMEIKHKKEAAQEEALLPSNEEASNDGQKDQASQQNQVSEEVPAENPNLRTLPPELISSRQNSSTSLKLSDLFLILIGVLILLISMGLGVIFILKS
ncbi:MAG: FHA domain-containing protein [Deltaproteobacteria bacterium]|nr:FHA domain-containing protein [Deltaproteobacteria bacterium]